MPERNILLTALLAEDQLLLARRAPESPVDPGHWGAPKRALSERSVPRPHPLLCGVESRVAGGLADAFTEFGDDFEAALRAGRIEAIRQWPEQPLPPWSPYQGRLLSAELQLKEVPERTAIPARHEQVRWQPRETWARAYAAGELLLDPHSRDLFAAELPALPEGVEEPVAGLRILPIRSHTLPPADHTNAFLIGDENPILVDPSPANESAYADLKQRLRGYRVSRIFLTHHHPDHHQQATRLAREWSLPVQCSEDTRERIAQRYGAAYWQGIEVLTAAEGDSVATSLGRPVQVHAVPGHDAGQLALAPDTLAWMIVGDLIQGIGTVVIASPEGDMATYFATLERVIALAPRVIVPSHGQAMAGTYRLEQTLEHRRLRERQILELARSGADQETMLQRVYAGIDRRLWPLARQNIESHLAKLRQEGQL